MAHPKIVSLRKKKIKRKRIAGVSLAVFIVAIIFTVKVFSAGDKEINYELQPVKKGSIISSVSAVGQIFPMKQLDLKSSISERVVSVAVKNNQKVKQGDLIIKLDSKAVDRNLRDSDISLQSAFSGYQSSIEQNKLSKEQAKNALAQAEETKKTAEANLKKTEDEAFSYISNAFNDLYSIMPGLQSIVSGSGSYSNSSYLDTLNNHFNDANNFYNSTLTEYRETERSDGSVDSLLDNSIETLKDVSSCIKTASYLLNLESKPSQSSNVDIANISTWQDLVNYFQNNNQSTSLADQKSNIASYQTKVNSDLSQLLAVKQEIVNSQSAIQNASSAISEKNLLLDSLKGDSNPNIDIQGYNVIQKSEAYGDHLASMSNYEIRAPFDGIVTKLSVSKGDLISQGSSLATIITEGNYAAVSLSEIDTAKIKIGQKANITFDAIPDLTITGRVSNIDAAGTYNQGVVLYGAKIDFDVQDERIKAGMTINAEIITGQKDNVFIVPNSAIKLKGNVHYVDLFQGINGPTSTYQSKTLPISRPVEIGLVNDEYTEVIRGINEGEVIVVKSSVK